MNYITTFSILFLISIIRNKINTLELNTTIENQDVASNNLPNGFYNIGQTNQTDLAKLNSSVEINQAYINTDLANHNYTNFVQHHGNLVVNGTLNQPGSILGVSRNLASQKLNSSTSSSTSSSTIILIMVSLIAVTCIIAIVLTALFVMRRRFTVWRLNGSKSNSNGCNDGANGVLTNASSSESGSLNKCEGVVNDEKIQVNVVQTVNESQQVEKNGECVDKEELVEQIKSNDNVVEVNKAEVQIVNESEQVNQPEQQQVAATNLTEQPSSSSLIVNVLNELSESVACKLAAKSPTKSSTANLNTADPEKQPLNNNE